MESEEGHVDHYRTIDIASSSSQHRSIDPDLDGAIVNYVTLSVFHGMLYWMEQGLNLFCYSPDLNNPCNHSDYEGPKDCYARETRYPAE